MRLVDNMDFSVTPRCHHLAGVTESGCGLPQFRDYAASSLRRGHLHPRGTWGPPEADALLAANHTWHDPAG